MRYPVSDAADWAKLGHLPLVRRLGLWLRTQRMRNGPRGRWTGDLKLLGIARRAPAPDEVVLICVVRNASQDIRSFLDHYRKLGVSRFAFVDDRSDDGTRELLLSQPDVDAYGSNLTYREARGGQVWRDKLLAIYGRDRWYVSADSDEYLVFPGCEFRSVQHFIGDLKRHGMKRALAAMIDIYPDGPLQAARDAMAAGDPVVAGAPLIDGTGYWMKNDRYCMSVHGGPRFRIFGADMRQTKFPVLFGDRATGFTGASPHAPFPLTRNFSPVHAVLLHNKFAPGAAESFREIVGRGSHAKQSGLYRAMIEHPDFGDGMDLRYEGSRRYAGSEDLVKAGFMCRLG